jgi:hypothetical protein
MALGALARFGLLLERHRAWMAIAGPRGEDQQKAGIGPRGNRVALGRVELEEVAGICRDSLSESGDVDLAVDDDHPCALVHLVLLHLLPGRKMQHYGPRILS